MSNFPYNTDKYEYGNDWNGAPITFKEIIGFADKILYWHTEENTSDWSQSGDSFDEGVHDLAFGLLEFLSDPNAIKRLVTTGREVSRNVNLVLGFKNPTENFKELQNILSVVFEGYLK